MSPVIYKSLECRLQKIGICFVHNRILSPQSVTGIEQIADYHVEFGLLICPQCQDWKGDRQAAPCEGQRTTFKH